MREKKKTLRPFAFMRRRQFRIGGYALLVTFLFISIIVLVNIGVKTAEDEWALRLDLSYNSLTTVSDQTRAVLSALDEDVKFYVLATQGEADARLMEVLERYRALSGRISVQAIEPDRNPAIVSKFRDASSASSFGTNTVIATNGDETRYRVYAYTDLVTLGMDQSTGQYYIQGFNYERMLTQAIQYIQADRTPTVYLLKGHGEVPLPYITAMQALLEDNNHRVLELELAGDIPAGRNDLLLILSPAKDLTDAEREKLIAYLTEGGNLLYVCDVGASNSLPNFNSVLSYYGVGFLDGMVIADINDTAQYYPMEPTYLLPSLVGHDITAPLTAAGMDNLVFPQTRALSLPAMDRNDFIVTPLLTTNARSYLIDLSDAGRESVVKREGDVDGPFSIGAAIQRLDFADHGRESRVVLLGSTPAITDGQLLGSFYNGEFLLSAVRWATKDETVNLNIVSKTASRRQLVISSASEYYTLSILSVGLLPCVILVAGIVVWTKRRHL